MMRVSCRTRKLKSFNLSGVQKHNERQFDVPNANSEKTHLNRRLIGEGHLSDLVNNRIIETKAKVIGSGKNTSNVAVEIILSASPEYFRDNPDDIGVYDEKKMEAWVQRNEDFLKQKYGDNLVCLDLHLDEATPHLHAIITPLIYKKKSCRRTKEQIKNNIPSRKYEVFSLDSKTMFNRKSLINLQTEAALAVKDLGILRGIRGSKAKHTTLKEFYSSIINSKNEPLTTVPLMNHLSLAEILCANANIDNHNDVIKYYNHNISIKYNDLCNENKGMSLKNKSLNASLKAYVSLGNVDDIKQSLSELDRYRTLGTEEKFQNLAANEGLITNSVELDRRVNFLEYRLKHANENYDYQESIYKSKALVVDRAMYFLGKMPSEVRDMMHPKLKQDLDDYYLNFAPQDRPYQIESPDESPKPKPSSNSFSFDDDGPSF